MKLKIAFLHLLSTVGLETEILMYKAIKMLEAKLGQASVAKLHAPIVEAEFEEVLDGE